jgi:hypothetical protein
MEKISPAGKKVPLGVSWCGSLHFGSVDKLASWPDQTDEALISRCRLVRLARAQEAA